MTEYCTRRTPSWQALSAGATGQVRREYLKRFVRHEGQVHVSRFYRQLPMTSPEATVDSVQAGSPPTATRTAIVYASIQDTATADGLRALLTRQGMSDSLSRATIRLLEDCRRGKYGLADQGCLASVHPLKIWLGAYLVRHPGASRSEIAEASVPYLIEVYRWLTRTGGTPPVIGGKTGTGDHRSKVFDHAHRVVGEKLMNRTATFVFIAGDRFHGSVSAMVTVEEAPDYRFTSSLPVQLLGSLVPLLASTLGTAESPVLAWGPSPAPRE